MIYLDQASTSFPKPPEVLDAVSRWFRELGVSADRGDGDACAEVRQVVEDTRRRLAALCGTEAGRVGFTSGATESLNLALRAVLRPGDSVLTTALEHSSVVRPLTELRDRLDLRIEVLDPEPNGSIDADRAEAAMARGPRLLVFSHASNVLGSVVDARELCRRARARGCLTLVDASQSAGLIPLDVGGDLIAASAHKGLLGPPGLGFLAVRPDLDLHLPKQGGTGSAHSVDRHPDGWPQRLEAGTPNTPAIFGLHAALQWHDRSEADHLAAGLLLVDGLRDRLVERGYRVQGATCAERVPILSFTSDSYDPAELGTLLAEAGVHVRTGFHCAPWLHRHLGTEVGGTVRVSFGPFHGDADCHALTAALP